MPTSVQVMTANAMRLAADQYNDSTAFVNILLLNNLDDYHINAPVTANLATTAKAGQQSLIFPPTDGVELGDYVYCSSLHTYAVVTNVEQNFSVPDSEFCVCNVNTATDRVLPPQGEIVSTTITIAPGLDLPLDVGSPVMFAVGAQSTVFMPNPVTPASQGVPG